MGLRHSQSNLIRLGWIRLITQVWAPVLLITDAPIFETLVRCLGKCDPPVWAPILVIMGAPIPLIPHHVLGNPTYKSQHNTNNSKNANFAQVTRFMEFSFQKNWRLWKQIFSLEKRTIYFFVTLFAVILVILDFLMKIFIESMQVWWCWWRWWCCCCWRWWWCQYALFGESLLICYQYRLGH